MIFTGLFIDGPKAGEIMAWVDNAPIRFEYVLPRQLTTLNLGDNIEPIDLNLKTVTYRVFMASREHNLLLYSCGPTNPWEILTDVLAPLLKLARAETERQLGCHL